MTSSFAAPSADEVNPVRGRPAESGQSLARNGQCAGFAWRAAMPNDRR